MGAGAGQIRWLTRIGALLGFATGGPRRARMWLAGLCATVGAFAGMAALMAGTAAAAGPAFNPATPTAFVAQGAPTQLEAAVQSNGQLVFQNIGPPGPVQYNGIAYDTVDNYIYGLADGSGGGITAGDVVQVAADGSVTDTGVATGIVAGAAGGWDPADGEVYFVNNAGNMVVYNPATNATSTLTLSSPANIALDVTYADGYFWGTNGTSTAAAPQLVRIDPTTGTVTDLNVPSSLFPGTPNMTMGADWTYGNGNLGFSNNTSGNIYQISIANPGAASPTFTLVSSQPGPPNGGNDGAANPGLPTDLAMHKTASSQVPDGGQVTYTLTVSDNGPGNSSGYTISDTLPAGLSNPTTTSTGCSITAGVLTCVSANPLAAGATSAPVTVTGTVANPFVTPITNTATVTANEQDPNPGNNSDGVTTNPSADLSIDKTASTLPAVPGENETYTLTAKNNGPDTAVNAVVSDPLPSGLSFVSASAGCTFASGAVTCPVGNMAPGATKTFQVVTKVASSDTDASVTNTASVSSTTPDSNPTNNYKTIVVPLNPQSSCRSPRPPRRRR